MLRKKYYLHSYLDSFYFQGKKREKRIKLLTQRLFVLLVIVAAIVALFKVFPLFYPPPNKGKDSAYVSSNSSEIASILGTEEEEKKYKEKSSEGIELPREDQKEEITGEEGELLSRGKEPEKPEELEEAALIVEGSLQAGDTLYESLIKEGISAAEILDLQEKVKSVVDFNYLPEGSEYSLKYNPEGKVTEFVYKPNPLDIYYIDIPASESEELKVTKEEVYTEVVRLEGEIKSSLYESMIEYANSAELAMQMADIFGWEIDFFTECRVGDTFKILVEKQCRGDFCRWGKVLAAQYEGELLSKHTAILFEDPSGHIDYYNEEGESLKRAFLRAPLNYRYISSYFSENRLHPILRIWRPHLAIDYAAPAGTPVSAIGDGTVIYKGWKGDYGNYVEIRHPNNYVSGYGHLSRFAESLKKGQKVKQGEIIGYVGATGLATGPHLDFSLSKDGKKVDFLKLELPAASSVNPQYKSQFDEAKNELLSALEGRNPQEE